MANGNLTWMKWSFAGLVAMTSYYGYSQMTTYSSTPAPQQYDQQEIQQNLQFLLHEHGILLNQAIVAALKNAPSNIVESSKANLLRNSHEIASLLGSAYGPQAGQAFENLFNEHILLGSQYVNAVKANNQRSADQFSQQATGNGRILAKFFTKLNSSIPYGTWQEMFDHHVMLEAKQAQAYFKGDLQTANQLKEASLVQLGEMANLIASVILRKPSSQMSYKQLFKMS